MTKNDTKTDAFFITPIGDAQSPQRARADTVLECILRPALVPKHVMKVDRVDLAPRAGFITSTVIEKILRARLVVADITGLNPNVFYELAIAHAAHVPVVTIREPDSDIPFDISALNAIDCGLDIAGGTRAIEAIDVAATRLLEHPNELESPVKTALLLLGSGSTSESEPSLEATVLRRLEQIESGIARVLDREVPLAYENEMLWNRDARERLRRLDRIDRLEHDSTVREMPLSDFPRYLAEGDRLEQEAQRKREALYSTLSGVRESNAPRNSRSSRPSDGAAG